MTPKEKTLIGIVLGSLVLYVLTWGVAKADQNVEMQQELSRAYLYLADISMKIDMVRDNIPHTDKHALFDMYYEAVHSYSRLQIHSQMQIVHGESRYREFMEELEHFRQTAALLYEFIGYYI